MMLAVASLLATTAGCGLFGDPAAERTEEFLRALAEGDTDRAAALTDAPDEAAPVLEQAYDALDPESVDIAVADSQEADGEDGDDNGAGDVSIVEYDLGWHLEGDREWHYTASARLGQQDGDWVVQWDPAVVHPEHAEDHTLALIDVPAELPPVLDRGGDELLAPQRVTSVLLDPVAADAGEGLEPVARTLAEELSQFDEGITTESILAGASEAGEGGAHLVAALREDHFQQVVDTITDLAGVHVTWQERLLGPTPDFGTPVLPALRSMVNDEAAANAGWRVVTLDGDGAESAELHAEQPEPIEQVDTVMSHAVQSAAEQALDGVAEAGALVALSASEGDVLAVAQNEAADESGSIALTGQYPPGSTFKIVTAAAALSAGEVSAGGGVNCPGSMVIGQREITNDRDFDLGTIDLSEAFARSCNTTFAELAVDSGPGALGEAAASLGLGAEFDIPGIGVFTGDVPEATGNSELAENGIGQGTVLASPFGMALATAAVAGGEVPTPTVLDVDGSGTEASGVGEPLAAEVTGALRELMRAVVTRGTASELDTLDGVHGKTGTAQFGDGSDAHGWFVGYQDDIAFAVLLVGGGSSAPAVSVAGDFLGELTDRG
ncbi:penicillin-binding protein [Haloechinothrix sp. LS1_15]|nr:penicillin-binding protein [Haloechinothrix sp. LS1_15]